MPRKTTKKSQTETVEAPETETQTTTAQILRAMLFTPMGKGRWGVPMLIEGRPGTGKSAIIEQTAETLNLPSETVIASIREPSDFAGLPIPHTTENFVSAMPAGWAHNMAKQQRGVVFLDELNTAPPAVQSALLRVVLDRAVGDLQMPGGVRIIAATNNVEEAANGHDISPPLANRFLHWTWEPPTVEAWTSYLIAGPNENQRGSGETPGDIEARVMQAWPAARGRAAAKVGGFLQRRPELMHKQPDVSSPEASGPWPSHRSWDMAVAVLASAEVHGLPATTAYRLVAGCVGEGAAFEFQTFIKESDLPTAEEALFGKWKTDKRLDRTLAATLTCISYTIEAIRSESKDKEKIIGAMLEFMRPLMDETPDLMIAPLRSLIQGAGNLLERGTSYEKIAEEVIAKTGVIYRQFSSF